MNKVNEIVLLCGLSLFAWTDLKSRKIPNRMLAVLFFIRLFLFTVQAVVQPLNVKESLFDMLAGGICGSVPFGICYWFRRTKIGAGDVKLAAMTGIFLGKGLVFEALFFSVGLCAVFLCGLIFIKREKCFPVVPMAPFVLLGTLAAMKIC